MINKEKKEGNELDGKAVVVVTKRRVVKRMGGSFSIEWSEN